jgi:hypothetical protein
MLSDNPNGKLAKWKHGNQEGEEVRQAIRKGYECDTHIVMLSLFCHR